MSWRFTGRRSRISRMSSRSVYRRAYPGALQVSGRLRLPFDLSSTYRRPSTFWMAAFASFDFADVVGGQRQIRSDEGLSISALPDDFVTAILTKKTRKTWTRMNIFEHLWTTCSKTQYGFICHVVFQCWGGIQQIFNACADYLRSVEEPQSGQIDTRSKFGTLNRRNAL